MITIFVLLHELEREHCTHEYEGAMGAHQFGPDGSKEKRDAYFQILRVRNSCGYVAKAYIDMSVRSSLDHMIFMFIYI